ncbi:MAG: apolipoprotein N-acyltransferase [Candidatus Xenobium sp.]|jgi:apolipoprotein N-acyltransferase|nr:apolipoprotein N-acyltransferase [Burkholderiales bacterium]
MSVHGGESAEGVEVSRGFSPARSGSFRLPFWQALLLALASALLLHLSFPHARLHPLAWLALIPFLLACRGQGLLRGTILGLVLGICSQTLLLSWTLLFGPLALVGAVCIRSIAPALLGAVLGRRRPGGAVGDAFFAASAWVAMEFLHTLGPLGVTWGMLGHTQARVPVLIQVGALVGPWGLSFILAFTNAAVAAWVVHWRTSGLREGTRRAGPALAWAAGFCSLALLFGTLRLAYPPAASGPPLAWGVVQVSMPQNVKWDPAFQAQTMDRLEALTRQAAAQGAQAVVWPETSIPYRGFLQTPALTFRISRLARDLGIWLLVGSIESAGHQATFNTVSLFSPQGHLVGRHDKHRLVPFGEFLPWKRYLPPLPQLDLVMNYKPGPRPHPLDLGGTPVGVLICYESMISHLPADLAAQGARFLLVPTNDAWFGETTAAAHHFDMAILRAVETGCPTIQAGNTGISGFVSATGEVLSETRLMERGVRVARLVPISGETLYTRIGDLLAWACVAWTLLAVLASLSPRSGEGQTT